jgi:alpha-tubulin suppressor-like RCC1 family protein
MNLTRSCSCAASHAIFITEKGDLHDWTPELSMATLPLDAHLRALPISFAHNLILFDTGEAYGWGANRFGCLGNGENNTTYVVTPTRVIMPAGEKIIQAGCGIQFSVVLTKSGNVYTFGDNKLGELGLGDLNSRNLPEKVFFFGRGVFFVVDLVSFLRNSRLLFRDLLRKSLVGIDPSS